MVAAVAIEEPQTAPKQADAPMVASDTPPLTPERMTRAALSSADSPVPDAIDPVKMKSGMIDNP